MKPNESPAVREEAQAVATRDNTPLSLTQVKAGIKAIHEVMKECMVDGQDYGKVPGCGDKPGLFQPGAQKLSMMFQLNPAVQQEVVTDYPNFHRGYRLVVRVEAGGKFAEGVGECSTMETKYRYRNSAKKCPECGKETIIKGKAEYGGGWLCYQKKGGCGWKCGDNTPAAAELIAKDSGKVEHENPPDFWNTVRKMAFKRAFVHAIINATNTSELWSQDLEDLAANGVVRGEEAPQERQAEKPAQRAASPPKAASKANQEPSPSSLTRVDVMFDDYKMVSSKKGAPGKPWVLYACLFSTDSGSQIEACTFSKEIGGKLDVLKGQPCTISHQPGRKSDTIELMTIEPQTDDDMPM